jgi:hypothetical protein
MRLPRIVAYQSSRKAFGSPVTPENAGSNFGICAADLLTVFFTAERGIRLLLNGFLR